MGEQVTVESSPVHAWVVVNWRSSIGGEVGGRLLGKAGLVCSLATSIVRRPSRKKQTVAKHAGPVDLTTPFPRRKLLLSGGVVKKSVQPVRQPLRGSPAKRPARGTRSLLDRLLDTPRLAQVVPRLSPEILHHVIQRCGLEDCGELVALATPGQLSRVFDLDLWRPARAGLDEELDADRFGIWLEILMESGASVAAQKLAGMDIELVVTALAQHVLVFDQAAVAPSAVDGHEMPEHHRFSDRAACEIGSYLIEAKRNGAWDVIVDLLLLLDAELPDYFHRLMRACRNLSNSGYEIDGLDDLLSEDEQDMFDLAVDREQRRERQGYVTPAQARAFLHAARELQLANSAAPPPSPAPSNRWLSF
jgi:hypothetical protein